MNSTACRSDAQVGRVDRDTAPACRERKSGVSLKIDAERPDLETLPIAFMERRGSANISPRGKAASFASGETAERSHGLRRLGQQPLSCLRRWNMRGNVRQ